MATKTINDLLPLFMQDVYYAERQILKALPKMAKATDNEELKTALMHHRDETQGQVAPAKDVRGTRQANLGSDLRGDQRPDRGRRGDYRRDAGGTGAGCRHHCLRTSGGALRDGPLRGDRRLGERGARRGRGQADARDSGRREKKTDALLDDLAKRGINQEAKQAA